MSSEEDMLIYNVLIPKLLSLRKKLAEQTQLELELTRELAELRESSK